MEASLLVKHSHILAESPLWHRQRNSLFWVDIDAKTLHEYSFGTKTVLTTGFSSKPGFVVQGDKENLIIGLQKGIASYNLETEQLLWLKEFDKKSPNYRCNDGKCDSTGSLWFGIMHVETSPNTGALYFLDAALNLTRKIEGLTIPNGMAWSLDNQHFYHIDSIRRSVVKYRYNEGNGAIAAAETVITIPEHLGLPDGMTIDKDGMLWIAHYGGFGVYRWNPNTGVCIEKITLPVPNATSCTFGGQNLDTLFITTASENMGAEDLETYPLSGCIFMAKPKIKGLKANILKL